MGIAYLSNGQTMDYEEYLKTPEWRAKKFDRLAFDNWQCGICHKDLGKGFETHHLIYSRLGHEKIEADLISICHECHLNFHNYWQKSNKWEGSPLSHWKDYSFSATAEFCAAHLHEDFILGGESNMCNLDIVGMYIEEYCKSKPPGEAIICEEDVRLFFRNERYKVFFNAVENGEELEAMLDRMFGIKGIKGGNPKRAEARRFFTKHKLAAMKRIYNENENIIRIQDAVNKIINKENNNE